MKRFLFNFFFILIATLAGTGMFLLKYKVIREEKELAALQRSITEDLREIHILKAEWAHLTDPNRLRTLIELYTPLEDIAPDQVLSMRRIVFKKIKRPKRKPDVSFLKR